MTLNNNELQFLLFAQHGWADKADDIAKLAQALANPQTVVTAPSLGLIKTFIRMEPLIQKLEQIASQVINQYPDIPLKVIGHSMGGLIWLEVLDRNPQWWHKIHSLILLGSPIGGSNIARIIDPLGWGIGTARDLGKNRRALAEKIAQKIPTLSVASDINMGSDGLVTVENTKFDYANWILLSGIPHHALKFHPDLIPLIQNFWINPQLGSPPTTDYPGRFIQRLRSVPGMTDTDYRNFERSRVVASFSGTTIHTWNNPLGINHVFVGQSPKQCLYAGYVGLIHTLKLRQAINEIRQFST